MASQLPPAAQLWVMGHVYSAPSQSIPSDAAHAIAQLFWITYRKRMPPLYRSQLTSDAGWGCMIRTAQMMLAHAFQRYFYGDGWREAGSEMQNIHDSILSMFVDDPSAVFSIHRIVERGTALGKRVGEWYGPNTISAVITELVNECHRQNHGSSFACCNFDSQMVSIESVRKAASSSLGPHASPDVWASSVMIFVPVRLGLDSLNPEYHEAVLRLIEMPSSLGIIGGSPRHSLYFVGKRKERMLYLDPHTTQACIGVPTTSSSIADFERTELSRSRSDPQASELADARWGDGSPFQPPSPARAARQPPAILRSSSSSIAQHSPTRNAITSSYSRLSELVSSSIAYLAGGAADGGTAPALPCPLTDDNRGTYHRSQPAQIHVSRLDPSMALGFFFKRSADFTQFCDDARRIFRECGAPLFDIRDSEPDYERELADRAQSMSMSGCSADWCFGEGSLEAGSGSPGVPKLPAAAAFAGATAVSSTQDRTRVGRCGHVPDDSMSLHTSDHTPKSDDEDGRLSPTAQAMLHDSDMELVNVNYGQVIRTTSGGSGGGDDEYVLL